MKVEDLFDELVAYISESGRENNVAEVKKDYYKDAGSLHGDEATYHMRIASFLEWYVLDRTAGGKTFLEEYIEKLDEGEKKEAFRELCKGIRTVFEIKKADDTQIHLKDLRDGKRYFAIPVCGTAGLNRGDILDARLLPCEGKLYLAGSYILHPVKAKKFITRLIQDAENRQDTGRALKMLSNMSLKWERFRNYDLEDIYRIKEK